MLFFMVLQLCFGMGYFHQWNKGNLNSLVNCGESLIDIVALYIAPNVGHQMFLTFTLNKLNCWTPGVHIAAVVINNYVVARWRTKKDVPGPKFQE